jgi:hypothetical protein
MKYETPRADRKTIRAVMVEAKPVSCPIGAVCDQL